MNLCPTYRSLGEIYIVTKFVYNCL